VVLTIPAEVAWKVAEQLARSGSVKRGYLGVRSEAVELLIVRRRTLIANRPRACCWSVWNAKARPKPVN